MIDKGRMLLMAVSLLAVYSSAAQQAADREQQMRDKMAAPNPIEASDSLWIEELTYMEVRDRIAEGFTTAIVPAGSIEENGPYLATGKHLVILRAVCPAIARELGNALCAPVVPFEPASYPPPGAARIPGSFTLRDETYHALLVDIAESLRLQGFRNIVLIGDSGGNQRGMEDAAWDLNNRWRDLDVAAHFVKAYYTPGWEETEKYTADVLGVSQTKDDGHHDDIWVTAMMMVTDPTSVRYYERVEAGLASINGVKIAPMEETIELGRKMVAFRAKYTADAIRKSMQKEAQGIAAEAAPTE